MFRFKSPSSPPPPPSSTLIEVVKSKASATSSRSGSKSREQPRRTAAEPAAQLHFISQPLRRPFSSDGYNSDSAQGRLLYDHGRRRPQRSDSSHHHQEQQHTAGRAEVPEGQPGQDSQHSKPGKFAARSSPIISAPRLNTRPTSQLSSQRSHSTAGFGPPASVPPSFARPSHLSVDLNSKPERPPRNPARATRGLNKRPSTASGVLEGNSVREMTSTERSVPATTSSRSPKAHFKSSKTSPTPEERSSQFSTADRTILNELLHNLSARNSQFTTKNGKRHHTYSEQVVPFPRSYDRVVLDHEMWEVMATKQFNKTVTFHSFEKPPEKVLDVGCGSGSWIISTAQVWKQTRFVGLDVVPLHPDLHRTGQTDLRKRVKWVQANFLETLPFPNDEFDFVMVSRIARGVPENKWDALFEELFRVMKPGGAIEIVEEDLYFPGSVSSLSLISNESTSTLSTLSLAPSSRRLSLQPYDSDDSRKEGRSALSSQSQLDAQKGVTAGTTETMVKSGNPVDGRPSNNSPAQLNSLNVDSGSKSPNRSSRLSEPILLRSAVSLLESISSSLSPPSGPTRKRSYSFTPKPSKEPVRDLAETKPLSKELEELVTSMIVPVSLPFSSVGGLSMPTNISLGMPSTSTSRLPLPSLHHPGSGEATQTDEQHRIARESNPAVAVPTSATSDSVLSTVSTSAVEDVDVRDRKTSKPHSFSDRSEARMSEQAATNSKNRSSKTLLQSPSKAGLPQESQHFVSDPFPDANEDPHDHSLLERIYREMHESRFINLSPLALLPNLLNSYFSAVTSHPPFSLHFPPEPPPNGPPTNWEMTSRKGDSELGKLSSAPFTSQLTMASPSPKRSSDASASLTSTPKRDAGKRHSFVAVDNLRSPASQRFKSGNQATSDSDREFVVGSSKGSPTLSSPDKNESSKAKSRARSHSRSQRHLQQQQSPDNAEDHARLQQSRLSTLSRFERIQNMQHSGTVNKGEDDKVGAFPPHDLNMHLSVRVQETLACAESMWEWVQAEQEKWRSRVQQQPERLKERQSQKYTHEDAQMRAIREMTRTEFDALLEAFEADMKQCISLNRVLEQYLDWCTALPATENKKGGILSQPRPTIRIALPEESEKDSRSSISSASDGNSSSDPFQRGSKTNSGASLGSEANVRFSRSFRIFCAWKPPTT